MSFERTIGALGGAGRLEPAEEALLWRKYTPDARARIITAYQPLVARALKALSPSEAYFEDCLSEGLLALIQSADRFEQERGVSFATYARLRIKGAMIDCLRKTSRTLPERDERDCLAFLALTSNSARESVDQDRLYEVLSALSSLRDPYRKVLTLIYIEGKTRSEAAEELGLSPSRISQISTRGIRILRGKVFAKRKLLRLRLARSHG